jgi:hypothetical protein
MSEAELQKSQQFLYDFFLQTVKRDSPDEVMATFRRLFVEYTQSSESDLPVALYTIVIANNEQEFKFTLKRICYILINNWGVQRHHEAIKTLIQTFEDKALLRTGISVMMKRLRAWIRAFITSEDFKDLQLFAARYEEQKHWSEHYTPYLLVPQYLNLENPIEQRDAARTLSLRLKEEFRFNLAMYTARSQFSSFRHTHRNPTMLGESALNLVKLLLLRPGQFSYENLANVFRQQSDRLSLGEFKRALLHYLMFGLPQTPATLMLQQQLPDPVLSLYTRHNHQVVDEALMLRTCNRVLEILTTVDRKQPSRLFSMFLAQGNPLILVILLLKITLFCRNVQAHLELRIADLIRYYETFSEADCRWVINFFEVFRITFSVYAENTEYNLVKIHQGHETGSTTINLDTYRIFSQLRRNSLEPDINLYDLGEYVPVTAEDPIIVAS